MAKNSSKGGKRTPPNPNPEYEFLGPPGAVAMLIVLPLITYGLYFNCRPGFGCIPAFWDPKDGFWPSISTDPTTIPSDLWNFFVANWDSDAFDIYSVFMVFLFVCYFVIPGRVVEGTVVGGVGGSPLTKDRSNYKLKYKINALKTLVLIAVLVIATLHTRGVEPFLFLHDHFVGLITASLVWTFGVSIFVYSWSFLPDSNGQEKILAHGGNTGNKIYDVSFCQWDIKGSILYLRSTHTGFLFLSATVCMRSLCWDANSTLVLAPPPIQPLISSTLLSYVLVSSDGSSLTLAWPASSIMISDTSPTPWWQFWFSRRFTSSTRCGTRQQC